MMKWFAKGFDCPYVTKSLYTSLVRPILEYATVAWSPFLACDITRIESVQKQFLLFALCNLGWAPGFSLPSYEARSTLMDMDSLTDRRLAANCFFAASNLLGLTSASHPGKKFVFNCPVRLTRSSLILQLQHLPTPRSSYSANSPIRRCINSFNQVAHIFSPTGSLNSFKDAVFTHLHEQRRARLQAAAQQREP